MNNFEETTLFETFLNSISMDVVNDNDSEANDPISLSWNVLVHDKEPHIVIQVIELGRMCSQLVLLALLCFMTCTCTLCLLRKKSIPTTKYTIVDTEPVQIAMHTEMTKA